MRVLAILLLLALLTHANALASRPFDTEDAGVAEQGSAAVEVSWDNLRWSDGTHDSVYLIVPIYGLTKRLEVSAELPYLDLAGSECGRSIGAGDACAVAKYAIVAETARVPALTLKGSMKSHTGNCTEGLGTGDWDFAFGAAVTKNAGRFIFHASGGRIFRGRRVETDAQDTWYYSAAVEYALTERLHLCGELGGNTFSDRIFHITTSRGLAGLTLKLSQDVILDAAFRFSLGNEAPTGTTLGLSISL